MSASDNERRLRELLAAVDAGDLEGALAFYHPAYRDHDASESRQGTDHVAALRTGFAKFYDAFTGTRHTIHDVVAAGDKVAARISVEARHTGEMFGIPASGQTIRNDSIAIYRFEDGLIRERWCRERRSTRDVLTAAATRGEER